MKLMLPDYTVDHFALLDLPRLKRQGIKILFCDIDNTISKIGDTACSPEAFRFIERVRSYGIEPILFTNNTKAHVERVLGGYPDVELISFTCKPFPFSFWRALKKRHLKTHEAVVLGDQLFTDILGGQIAGIETVLCAPLSENERKDTQFLRLLENQVYQFWENKGKLRREDGHVRLL